MIGPLAQIPAEILDFIRSDAPGFVETGYLSWWLVQSENNANNPSLRLDYLCFSSAKK